MTHLNLLDGMDLVTQHIQNTPFDLEKSIRTANGRLSLKIKSVTAPTTSSPWKSSNYVQEHGSSGLVLETSGNTNGRKAYAAAWGRSIACLAQDMQLFEHLQPEAWHCFPGRTFTQQQAFFHACFQVTEPDPHNAERYGKWTTAMEEHKADLSETHFRYLKIFQV